MLPNREQVHTHTFSWEEKLQNKNKLFSIGNLKEQYITKIFHMLKENITVTESVRWGSDAITYLLGSLSAKQWAIKLHMILLLCKSLFICHIWQVLFVSYLFLPQENKIIIIKKKLMIQADASCPNMSEALLFSPELRFWCWRQFAEDSNWKWELWHNYSHGPDCHHSLRQELTWLTFCCMWSYYVKKGIHVKHFMFLGR